MPQQLHDQQAPEAYNSFSIKNPHQLHQHHPHHPVKRSNSLQHPPQQLLLLPPSSRRASAASGIQTLATIQQCNLIVADDLPVSAVSPESRAERQWRWSRLCLRCFTCVVLGFVLAVAGGTCFYRAALMSSWWSEPQAADTTQPTMEESIVGPSDSAAISRYRLAGAWLLSLGGAITVFGCVWAAKSWCQANQTGCYGSSEGATDGALDRSCGVVDDFVTRAGVAVR